MISVDFSTTHFLQLVIPVGLESIPVEPAKAGRR
jgi:hypothetical protein